MNLITEPAWQAEDLIRLFNQTFLAQEQTCLVKGQDEPVYLPGKGDGEPHQVIFAHGFFASALHEVAHWCIAGRARRQLVDYGYWYEPDGRSASSQAAFAAVEAKPQALEWCLHKACGHPFVVSLDNLDLDHNDFADFKLAVFNEAKNYQKKGLPPRALRFFKVLAGYFNQPLDLETYEFSLEVL